jgi:hypothetical protein
MVLRTRSVTKLISGLCSVCALLRSFSPLACICDPQVICILISGFTIIHFFYLLHLCMLIVNYSAVLSLITYKHTSLPANKYTSSDRYRLTPSLLFGCVVTSVFFAADQFLLPLLWPWSPFSSSSVLAISKLAWCCCLISRIL